jgi:3D (Asp-Asp-Asp) domain-containing protein
VRASGPKNRRGLVLLVVLAACAAGLAVVAGVARADDPSALRGEADRLRSANASLDAESAAALLELYALESRLRGAERRLARLEREAEQLEEREASARLQLDLARQSEAAAQDALADRVRALYVEGDTDPLEIIFGASSLDGMIDAIDSVNRVADHDRRIIEQVRRTRGELRTALAAFTRRERELRELTRQAEAAKATLASARDAQAAYLDSLARQRNLNAREIAALTDRAAEAEQLAAEITAAAPAPTEPEPEAASVPAAEPETGPVDVSSEPGRQVTVSATMYCLRGTTATGVPVQPGIVATDPSYIPLGTRMFVPGYGEGVAADTGGAVKGWTIDLWVASCAVADTYGRQTITITIY